MPTISTTAKIKAIIKLHGSDSEGRKEKISPLLYNLFNTESLAEEVVVDFRSAFPSRDRRALEQLLLENAGVLEGREFENLTQVFELLGYVDEDIAIVQHGRNKKKAESASHLGAMRTERAVPSLISVLSSSNPEVKLSALNALSKVGTPEAIEAVVDYLSTDHELEAAGVAEVILKSKQAFSPYLGSWLQRGEPDIPRLTCLIDLVGVIREEKAVPALLGYLSHADPHVRARAARSLGNIGDDDACSKLAVALFDDDSGVQMEAALALGRARCSDAIPLLKACLLEPNPEMRMNCALALSQLGEKGQAALEEEIEAAEEQGSGLAAEVLQVREMRHGLQVR